MNLQAFIAAGYTPILAIASDGTNRVHQVVGWTGGYGSVPSTGMYIGSAGYVANITDGVNLAGVGGGGGAALQGSGAYTQNSGTIQFSNINGVTFGLTDNVMTASVQTAYQSQGAYLTTARASNDAIGLNTALTANGVSMTANSSGLSLNFPAFLTTAQPVGAYLTTAALSNHSHNFATTTTNGSLIVVGTTNSEGATIAVPAFLTTAQPVGAYLTTAMLSNAATISNINVSAGTTSNNLSALTFNNANGVTFGLNGSTITASVAAAGGAQTAISGIVVSDTTYTSGTVSYRDGNGISFASTTGQGISITHDLQYTSGTSAITSNAFNTSGSSRFVQNWKLTGNTAGTTSSAAGSDLWLAGGNGVTLSGSSNSISFSVATNYQSQGAYLTTARASNDAIGLNTAQSNVTWTVNSSGLSLDARGYAGTGTSATNASITLNSNGLAISVAAPGAAAENNWHHALGANTAGNTTASGSTIGLSGINLTISGTNGSVMNLSVPATSSLSATGQVSISVNGDTISIGVPNPATVSGWNPYQDIPLVAGQQGQGTLQFDPIRANNIQFDRIAFPIVNTNSSNSSGSHTLSFWVGIYSRNVSTLSLVGSTSASTALTHSGTAGSYSLYSGIRLFTIGSTSTLTQGDYWIGFLSRTTSGGANGSYSNMVCSNINSNFLGFFGSSHNTTYQLTLGQGVYTATTSGIPASVAFTQIRGSDSMALRANFIMFASSTI